MTIKKKKKKTNTTYLVQYMSTRILHWPEFNLPI